MWVFVRIGPKRVIIVVILNLVLAAFVHLTTFFNFMGTLSVYLRRRKLDARSKPLKIVFFFFLLLMYVLRDIVYAKIKMYNFHFLTGCMNDNFASIPESGIESLLWQWNPDHCSCSPSFFLHTEFILISMSRQSSLQQRHCAYHVTSKKSKFTTAGNVSGSVQLCKNTQCCVGYYVVISGQPKVDILGEKIQPGRTGLD